MDDFKVDTVDARKHHVSGKQRTLLQDILAKTPASVWLVLACVLVVSILYLRVLLERKSAAAKQVLNQRRKAGIPDSDRRPWRIAYVDAEKARIKRDKEKSDLLLMQKRPAKGLTRSATVNSTLTLPPASPYARSPRIMSRDPSNYEPHPWSRAPSPALSNTYDEQTASKTVFRAESPQVATSHYYRRSSIAPVFQDSRPASPAPSRPSLIRPHSAIGLEDESSKKRKLDLSDADTDIEEEKKSPKKRAAPASDATSERTKRSRPNPISTSKKVPGGLVAEQGSDESDDHQEGQADMSLDQQDGDESRTSKSASQSGSSRKRKKGKKRSREEDESVVSRAPKKKNRKVAAEKRAKEWTNLVGEKFMLNDEGKEVKLVEVKEWKLKYQMPPDSRHPDKDLKELVAVERWVDEEEFDRLKKASMLAWQPASDSKAPKSGSDDASMSATESEANSSRNLSIGEKSLFYARGPGTPLRSSTPQGKLPATTIASASPRLLNGRIRIPSTTKQPRRSLGLPNPTGSAPRLKKRTGSTVDSLNASTSFDSPSSSLNPSRDASPAPSNTGSPAPAILPNLSEAKPSFSAAPKLEQQGLSTMSNVESSKPTFSFGIPPAPSPVIKVESKPEAAIPSSLSIPSSAPSASKPTFSFGPLSTAPKTQSEQPKAAFSFGAQASTPSTQIEQPKPVAAGFSFGNAAPSPAQKEATKPAFSFGSTSTQPPQAEQPKAAPSGFSFGASPKPSTPNISDTSSKATSFSFGQSATNAPASQPAFSFGSQPAASQAQTANPSFGNPTLSPSSSFGASNQPSGASFTFGTSTAPQNASPGSFTFGASSGTASPAFGQSPVSTPSTQPAGFSFGAAPAATFNAGSATTDPNAPPRSPVRPIRRAPVRRR